MLEHGAGACSCVSRAADGSKASEQLAVSGSSASRTVYILSSTGVQNQRVGSCQEFSTTSRANFGACQ